MNDQHSTQQTRATRKRRYPTDMTDAEWQVIAPFLAPSVGPGAPRTVDIRAVVDAIFYRLRSGCQWRMLPSDFPAWPTVYYYFRKWGADGRWERSNTALREQVRRAAGRAPQPSAAIIDSQTVKSTEAGGERGYDGGKKSNGTQTAYCRGHAWPAAGGRSPCRLVVGHGRGLGSGRGPAWTLPAPAKSMGRCRIQTDHDRLVSPLPRLHGRDCQPPRPARLPGAAQTLDRGTHVWLV